MRAVEAAKYCIVLGQAHVRAAGHEFHGWQHPRVLTRASYFYIDPEGPLLDESIHFADIEFRPRLFFFDAELGG